MVTGNPHQWQFYSSEDLMLENYLGLAENSLPSN